jgi:hypothetical protein
MTYSRKDINKCLTQALKLSALHEKDHFVFATGNGFVIANKKPPITQDFYHISLRMGVRLIKSKLYPEMERESK